MSPRYSTSKPRSGAPFVECQTHHVTRSVRAFDGTDVGELLDDEVQAVIDAAIQMVDDQFVEEIAKRYSTFDQTRSRMFCDVHLPDRYRDEYTIRFVRRLHICFLQVVAHLAEDDWVGVACRGEEFALNAILNQLRINVELTPPIPALQARTETALLALTDAAFEDLDFEFAFDAAFDGIDDRQTQEGRQMRIAPLHPRSWFDALGELPPHPLARSHG